MRSSVIQSMILRLRYEMGLIRRAVDESSVGFILPVVVLLVEIAMIPTRLFAGSRKPASSLSRPELLSFRRTRARKIDAMICMRVLLALAVLFLAPGIPSSGPVVWAVWCLCLMNILASVVHYGIAKGRGGDALHVFNLPRVIILSLVNYFEVMLWFAAVYAVSGKFNVGRLNSLDALYFSGATIFTIGYGDIAPLGGTRLLAILEVLIGLLVLAILVSRMLGSARVIEELCAKMPPDDPKRVPHPPHSGK